MDRMPVRQSPETRSRPSGDGALRLGLIGGFGLWQAADAITLPTSAQRLVAWVALHDRPSLRPHVAASLWLDTSEARALANLRSALWRLRRPGLSIVEVHGDRLSLSPKVVVDVRELSQFARDLLSQPVRIDEQPTNRLTLAGELLPGWFEDWVFIERERFRHLRLHALERICALLAAEGEYGRAIDAGLAAVSEEPLRESAHRRLIEVHLAEGNRVEALRQFDAYRQLMRDELGLEPSDAMTDLVRDLGRRGRVLVGARA